MSSRRVSLAIFLLGLHSGAAHADELVPEVKETRLGDRLLSTSTYLGSVKHGPFRTYWDDGQVREEGQYAFGLEEGTWRTFDKKGALQHEKKYLHGLLHGESTSFADGSGPRKGQRIVFSSTSYVCGVKQGEFAEYVHATGNPRVKGSYQAGEKHGVWTGYRADGSVLLETVYVCGKKAEQRGSDGAATAGQCSQRPVRLKAPKRPGPITLEYTELLTRLKLGGPCCALGLPLELNGTPVHCDSDEPEDKLRRIRTRTGGGGTRG